MDRGIEKHIEEYTSGENPAEVETTAYVPRDAKRGLGSWKRRLSPEEAELVKCRTRELALNFYDDFDRW
jgi:hypothetical protein